MVQADGGLRYYVPYQVTGESSPGSPWSPTRSYFLRFYTDHGDLWRPVSLTVRGPRRGPGGRDRHQRQPELRRLGLLVVEHPPKPTTFKAVIGWERRRSGDRSNFEGVGVIR